MADGRRTPVHKRDNRKGLRPASQEEISEAYEQARKIVPLNEDPKTKGANTAHATLPGVTQHSGDRINAIIALRIQGFRDVDIAETIGCRQPEISRLESNHPDAFFAAEAHHMRRAEHHHKLCLWGIMGDISRYAPKMVKVLAELAEDPETKDNVRRQSAIDILNLSGVGYSRQTYGGTDRDLKQSAANVFVQNVMNKDKEYATVIEAEDAEVIESEEHS